MHARDRGHDGQAQAVVAIGLAARCVRAVEAVKQPGQMFCGNGLTLVLHRQRDLAGLRRADLYLYAASRRGIAGGIAQQIGQRPAQQSRIDLGLRTFEDIRLPTFPARLPLLHLDRIFVRGLRPLSAHVPHGRAWSRMSDHLPLIAELGL